MELRSAFVYQRDNLDLLERQPVLELLPHPDPGQRIHIVRSLTRIHNHGTSLRHPDSVLTVIFRTSDNAPIGGAVLDSEFAAAGQDTGPLPMRSWDEHEFTYLPHTFVLEPNDTLGVLTEQEPTQSPGTLVSVNILFAWYRDASVKFVQVIWIQTGNYFVGLKGDGTFWRANAVFPLVWTPA